MNSLAAGFVLIALAAGASPAPKAGNYKIVQRIEVGGDGGWDYLTLDSAAHRLYASRATRVMVFDVEAGKVVGEIPNTLGVHGVALAADHGRGYTSNGKANTSTIFDPKTLAVLGEVKTGNKPDAIIYDPASHRVFAFNGDSSDVTVIDGAAGSVAATIPLGGGPEFAAADGAGRVYVNLEDKNEVVAIDSKKLVVEAHWPLPGCEGPTGLSMDVANRRLFSGCSNKVLAVTNADTGRVIKTLPIGGGVDATAFDPKTNLVFSSNGDGTLTVIREDSPDSYSVVENVKTEYRAKTMALDPATHRIYLGTAKFGPAPSPTADQPHPRGPMIPGSFAILVLGN